MNANLSELLDPLALGAIRRGAAARRIQNREALLAAVPKSPEEAFALHLRAQGIDGVLAQIEADPARYFEEE